MTITESAPRPTVEPPSPVPAGRGADRPHLPPAVDAPRPVWRRRPSRSACITAAIGLLTLVLYTWNLSAGGYANGYYAAAVKSASVSWKALFFGSIDPGNFITVDKPPAALWLMGISARLFGFSSLSMLLPEALCGVGSVLLLHRIVRRWAGDAAAHLSALALAVTPVAALMFRFNNPDALLTFLGIASAWFLWKAVETGRTRSLLASAALVGLAFDTKMLQAVLLVPAFILVYLIAGPPKLGKRLLQLLAAAAALVVASGWWVAIVALWPASSRPYIGSTSDNSIISLITGYNGLGRIFGNSAGNGGGGGFGGNGNTGFGGTPGWLRTFNQALGGQISWLIPMAAAGLVAGLWLTRRAPRTDRARAGWLLFGGWAVVCATDVQPVRGNLPSVLHGATRTRRRSAGRGRRSGAVAIGPYPPTHALGAPDRDRGHGRMGGDAPRSHSAVRSVASTGHRRRRRALRRRHMGGRTTLVIAACCCLLQVWRRQPSSPDQPPTPSRPSPTPAPAASSPPDRRRREAWAAAWVAPARPTPP